MDPFLLGGGRSTAFTLHLMQYNRNTTIRTARAVTNINTTTTIAAVTPSLRPVTGAMKQLIIRQEIM